MNKYKISFCTVSMNRLHHLQQTLPQNIFDNQEYSNLEFIILDYNSSDNLENYIHTNYQEQLNTGRLIYYKTTTPQYFNRTHSRNTSFKLATGDILCNIDADNYTGVGFADYVNRRFNSTSNIYMRTLRTKKGKDIIGRICVKREDFYHIKGYDENMLYYGFEDYDFTNRLELAGVQKVVIANKGYLDVIRHSRLESLIHEPLLSNLNEIYSSNISPGCTDMLFLFNNGNFLKGTLVNNKTYYFTGSITNFKKAQLKYSHSILQDMWLQGTWNRNRNELSLSYSNEFEDRLFFDEEKNSITNIINNVAFNYTKITDQSKRQLQVMRLSQITSRIMMYNNLLSRKILVNETGFGNATVYKNFNYLKAIHI